MLSQLTVPLNCIEIKDASSKEKNEASNLIKHTFKEIEYVVIDWNKIEVPPEQFTCSLTKNLMTHPVQDAFGDYYEREAIHDARLKFNSSPLGKGAYTHKPEIEFPLDYILALRIEIYKYELSCLWNDCVNKKVERELALEEPKTNFTHHLSLDTEQHQEIDERSSSNNLSRR